jgi:hypothetical protein
MVEDKVRFRWLTRHSFASRKKDGAIHALKDSREKRDGRIKIPAYYGWGIEIAEALTPTIT